MTDFYSSAVDVVARTGVVPADLGQDDDTTLETFLEGILTEISDLINRRIGRNYLTEFDAGEITAIPPGLTGIAADVAADSIRTMVATRQTPVVRIDDFAVTILRSRVFSTDVRDRLRLYGNRGIGSVSLTMLESDGDEDLDLG